MEKQELNIIIAGDSFSDDGSRNDIFNYKYTHIEELDYIKLGLPKTIKIHQLFAFDLLKQKKYDIKIHTIARGSYGNHVIATKFKNKVLEIKETNPNAKIYGIIQFSALVRQGYIGGNGFDINVEDYPYDYLKNIEFINYAQEKEIFEKHFENIENLNKFCEEQDVEKYMFFGWANIFSGDVDRLQLNKNRVERLKKIVNFYKYETTYDEVEIYCNGKKPVSIKDFFSFGKSKVYLQYGDEFGGLTEYVRTKLDFGHRYNLIFDPHPSTEAYYVFYTEIIKKWLISKGILEDIEFNLYLKNLLNNVFKMEYLKFSLLPNATYSDERIISETMEDIVYQNKIEDIGYIKNKLEKLNKTF
jgi:hypothetical protein